MKPDFILTDTALQSRLAHLLPEIPASLEWTSPAKVPELAKAVEELTALEVHGGSKLEAYYNPVKKRISVSARILEVLWAQSYGYFLFYKKMLAGVVSVGQEVRLDTPDLQEVTGLLRWAAAQMAGQTSAQWPSALPTLVKPYPDPEKVANQQSLVALAFVIHHELAHHRLGHSGCDIEEEKDADAAAADWLLSGYDARDWPSVVRAQGASVSLLFIACRGIHSGHHGGKTHPPGYQRLLHCLDRHIPAHDDPVWSFVAAMLDLHMQAAEKLVERQPCDSWREWVDVLIDYLSKEGA